MHHKLPDMLVFIAMSGYSNQFSNFCCILFLFFVCVFLLQSDNLLSYLTVEESLTYTALLALQQHSAEAIRKKVTFESSGCVLFESTRE